MSGHDGGGAARAPRKRGRRPHGPAALSLLRVDPRPLRLPRLRRHDGPGEPLRCRGGLSPVRDSRRDGVLRRAADVRGLRQHAGAGKVRRLAPRALRLRRRAASGRRARALQAAHRHRDSRGVRAHRVLPHDLDQRERRGPAAGNRGKIVDEHGRDCAPGETGELAARGENIFAGYWNDPEATRATLRDGWFHTGDMARVDPDGYITIVDRKKDMVLVSGYNVYPAEVEDVLFRHPKVADAAVIGVPDPYQGESVKAVVVPRAGSRPTEEEIIAYVRERLAAFKAPKSVALVESLPKNRAGKVLKRVLREQFSGRRTA
ncbi:MAG: hypothetical protein DMG07_25675 [Acidobacteria bacterium]|nr:MAG: hypothetical protein DMG07_25675 [Acidobacteriota bacterium]